MWIENSAMTAWFDKNDVYFSVDVGVGEPTIKLHTMVRYKYHEGKEVRKKGRKKGKRHLDNQIEIEVHKSF